MSLVSIIMPYYKKINFIDKTYNSITNQSYQNYELLIIYDDIDLNEYNYLYKLTNRNPKVKIFKNQKILELQNLETLEYPNLMVNTFLL